MQKTVSFQSAFSDFIVFRCYISSRKGIRNVPKEIIITLDFTLSCPANFIHGNFLCFFRNLLHMFSPQSTLKFNKIHLVQSIGLQYFFSCLLSCLKCICILGSLSYSSAVCQDSIKHSLTVQFNFCACRLTHAIRIKVLVFRYLHNICLFLGFCK